MEGNSDGVNQLEEGSTPGTEPVRGIGLRVTNIKGNNLKPRRGLYSTNNMSVIDGLYEISKPVELNADWVYGGEFMAATKVSHANPSSSAVGNVETNKSCVDNSESAINQKISYAKVVQTQKEPVKVNFRKLETDEKMDGVDVVIPVESVKQVNDRFANTLYGYFLGKRLAFPVVEYFAKNQWVKYGLVRLMMNAKGFFFFKFTSKAGMEKLMEDGPWMIRNVPIILNEWSPSVNIVKEDITAIPMWVKLISVENR